MVQGVRRFGAHHGLGAVGDGNAGLGHHLQVIGAVADGDGLLARGAEAVRQLAEFRGLCVRIDDRAEHPAAELAAVDFEDVGQGVVQPEALLEALGKECEAAGSQK